MYIGRHSATHISHGHRNKMKVSLIYTNNSFYDQINTISHISDKEQTFK